MNCEDCTGHFGDAVDGTLSPEDQARVNAHCRDCDDCRDLLNDLMEIHAAAATLDPLTPSPAVWNAIAADMAPQPGPSRSWTPASPASLRRGLLVAAALVMMLGAAAWFDLGGHWSAWRGAGGGSVAEIARTASTELQLAEQHYENAIRSLEQLTARRDGALDPADAADIARSLESIDRAITDSRAALEAEPDSFVAQTSLLEALRKKVLLLQETVTLMNTRS